MLCIVAPSRKTRVLLNPRFDVFSPKVRFTLNKFTRDALLLNSSAHYVKLCDAQNLRDLVFSKNFPVRRCSKILNSFVVHINKKGRFRDLVS